MCVTLTSKEDEIRNVTTKVAPGSYNNANTTITTFDAKRRCKISKLVYKKLVSYDIINIILICLLCSYSLVFFTPRDVTPLIVMTLISMLTSSNTTRTPDVLQNHRKRVLFKMRVRGVLLQYGL